MTDNNHSSIDMDMASPSSSTQRDVLSQYDHSDEPNSVVMVQDVEYVGTIRPEVLSPDLEDNHSDVLYFGARCECSIFKHGAELRYGVGTLQLFREEDNEAHIDRGRLKLVAEGLHVIVHFFIYDNHPLPIPEDSHPDSWRIVRFYSGRTVEEVCLKFGMPQAADHFDVAFSECVQAQNEYIEHAEYIESLEEWYE